MNETTTKKKYTVDIEFTVVDTHNDINKSIKVKEYCTD